VNEVFAARPLAATCLFDLAHTDPSFVDAMRCTHPHLDEQGHRRRSDAWTGAAAACAGLGRRDITPGRRADVAVRGVADLRAVRRLLRAELAGCCDAEQVASLELAVSELVTNAWIHGRPP